MIGSNIKYFRQKRNLSQRDFAELVGVGKSAVSSWEINRTEPSIDAIYKIAEVLEISTSDLLGTEPPVANTVKLSKGDQVILDMIHEISDSERSEILNRLFEMLNRQ